MAEQVYQFASADGVTQIHGVKWTPEGQPVAVLQIGIHRALSFIRRIFEQ